MKKRSGKKLDARRAGRVVLTYNVKSKTAKYLSQLARKLYRYRVFTEYTNPKTGESFTRGLDVVEQGEVRVYPYKDTLTPLIGHTQKQHEKLITLTGSKGVEKFYEKKLSPFKDGHIKGKRDVAGHIILNKNSEIQRRADGYNINLNINLKLQKLIEKMLDAKKKELGAKEILCGVMDPHNGQILSLASSNRYVPSKITKKSQKNRFTSFVEYTYEPGSVIKTITFALLLKEKKINPLDLVRTYNGRYRLGKKTITDTHRYEWLSASDVIVHSSNIGTALMAQKLTKEEFYAGLRSFGFAQRSGIDLPFEKRGVLPKVEQFKSEIYKATAGYGYGLSTNFVQLLKAYAVFNNNGRIVSPRLAKSLVSRKDAKAFNIFQPKPKQIIAPSVAKMVKNVLVKTVEKGTGTAALTEGVEVGGKTGTAHISRGGRYVNEYNSSFFGFANDSKNHHYTIGVSVVEPKEKYFASQTAVPVFKEIIQILIDEGFIEPRIILEDAAQ
jgi:cell division protein FtsI (penicillin-binding protein 3)